MGFPLDINGGADTIQTSFYLNGLNGNAVKVEKKFTRMIRVLVVRERSIKNVVGNLSRNNFFSRIRLPKPERLRHTYAKLCEVNAK